jgi:tRNA(Ile)-lysidine synthase
MPQWTDFGPGLMARPLMDVRREDIRAYAVANQLQWVDDDSNLDTRFDRNYIRHEIIPRLVQRWPSLAQTVSRSARYCAEAVALIDDAAKNLLQDINPGGEPWLPVAELTALSDVQQRNVLRHWIHQQGFNTPSSSQLQQLVQQVLQAAVDASPTVSWQGCEVRRYRQRLYIMPPLQPIFMAQPVSWALEQPLVIPGWGVLSARRDRGRGVAARLIEAGSVTIGFRQGGESIQPKGRAHHHALKKLFQEHGVPPWLRERVPLVYLDGELAAVEDWFIAASYAAKADEEGVIFQWQNPPAAASAPVGDVW